MRSGYWWDVYRDLCAKAAIFTMAFWILSLLWWGNTGEYMPFALTNLFLVAFWFASSWARRDG